MIKAGELRIGNSVFIAGHYENVFSVLDIGSELSTFNGVPVFKATYDEMNPIPLTPEWLERCGWQVVDQGSGPYYWLEKQCWLHIHVSEDGNIFANFNNNAVYLKSLHSLQNLYHALTGEELIITL